VIALVLLGALIWQISRATSSPSFTRTTTPANSAFTSWWVDNHGPITQMATDYRAFVTAATAGDDLAAAARLDAASLEASSLVTTSCPVHAFTTDLRDFDTETTLAIALLGRPTSPVTSAETLDNFLATNLPAAGALVVEARAELPAGSAGLRF
jgi:hypothetical protein